MRIIHSSLFNHSTIVKQISICFLLKDRRTKTLSLPLCLTFSFSISLSLSLTHTHTNAHTHTHTHTKAQNKIQIYQTFSFTGVLLSYEIISVLITTLFSPIFYANISTFNIRPFFPKFSKHLFIFSVHVQNGKKGRFYFCHLIALSGAWKYTQNCLQRPPLGTQKGQLPLFIGYL